MRTLLGITAITLAGSALAGSALAAVPITPLRPALERCLSAPGRDSCRPALELSHRLKQSAEQADQLRCYTALLGLEAVINQAVLGDGNGARQQRMWDETSRECR